MSVPNRIRTVEGGCYDDAQGLCYPAEHPVCGLADSPAPEISTYTPPARISREVLLADAFGNPARLARPISPWSGTGWQYSPLGAVASLTGCNGSEDPEPIPGDPIASVSAVAPESSLSGTITGKIRGVALSSAGSRSAVLWSVFDSDHMELSGTYSFLQNGASAGALHHSLPDTDAIHQSTAGAMLESGEAVTVYTRFTGEEEPSRLVARRIGSDGNPVGSEVTVLPDAVRANPPEGQVIPLASGFVVVFKEGTGGFGAVRYDNNGAEIGRIASLGDAPAVFRVARGEENEWALAEMIPGTSRIRVRTFEGLTPTGVDTTVNTASLAATPSLSIAMQGDGSMMLAYNLASGGIDGALLSPAGNASGDPFRVVTSGGLANTVSLASDHRGNFVLAYEQAGSILARIYNGTNSYDSYGGLVSITSGNRNSDIHASVSQDGVISLVWLRASDGTAGAVLQDIMRRDFRISYE